MALLAICQSQRSLLINFALFVARSRQPGRRVPASRHRVPATKFFQAPGPGNKVLPGRRVPATKFFQGAGSRQARRRVPATNFFRAPGPGTSSAESWQASAPGPGKLGGPRQARRRVLANKFFQGAEPGAGSRQPTSSNQRQARRRGRHESRSVFQKQGRPHNNVNSRLVLIQCSQSKTLKKPMWSIACVLGAMEKMNPS